ncbi:MAG: ABC transporter ATP-binding protein [Clostridia bacterium]|nr:ABC transporter ATP-binding protein [Clostridia bacterium]
MEDYVVEMLHITKEFPGIRANDDITLQLRRGEIHALLGENGAGKSTLMSVLFGLYQPDSGEIKKDGETVRIDDPNDANALGIGMVHQHFKLVHNFTVLQNIVLGVESTRHGLLKMDQARKRVLALSEQYGLRVEPDALISDITVGMQQRVEILKMLYRDNDILIFDEPTAVLTPQEIDMLMEIMRGLAKEGKSILFITHKLNEIMAVADRCTVLQRGRCIGTVDVKDTTREELSRMMVGRPVELELKKNEAHPGETALEVRGLSMWNRNRRKKLLDNINFHVRKGEIVCLAGIDGNGQSELIYALAGLRPIDEGTILLSGQDITRASVRKRNDSGLAHIPEDRHKDGLVLDYTLEENLVLKRYHTPAFQKHGFLDFRAIRENAERLIDAYDVRSGQGAATTVRSMSGGNQQKAIIAREVDTGSEVLLAVQPTRGLDVGAIENIQRELLNLRDQGRAILLVSLELEEVMSLPDRILVIYEGQIVAELDPKTVTSQELGLYMAGSKREEVVG